MHFISELEGFMGNKVFPFCSDSNLPKESSFGLDETDVEMGINREENAVLPSSTQYPNLEPTLYVDMSPSVLESPKECEPENGETEDAVPQNEESSLTPEIIRILEDIIPDPSYDLGNNSEHLDISLLEGFPDDSEVNNNYMESTLTPIINDTMMSHHPESSAATASTAHLDPPTISIPEEEKIIIPSDIEEMCMEFFENEALPGPVEDDEMTENSLFDLNIISNGTDDKVLPTSAGQNDLLQYVLQQCFDLPDQVWCFDFSCKLVMMRDEMLSFTIICHG